MSYKVIKKRGLVELNGDNYPLCHQEYAGTGVYKFQYFMRHSVVSGGESGSTLYLSSAPTLHSRIFRGETGALIEGQVELKDGDWAYFLEVNGDGCVVKAYLVKITGEWEEDKWVRESLLCGEGLDPHEWGPHPER